MTYGEYLRYCIRRTGDDITKTEFAHMLGLKDADHFIGATNDKPDKRPSIDLLERAARVAGFEFIDCIQEPKQYKKPFKYEHARLHIQLQELLERGEKEEWHASMYIRVHHNVAFRRRKEDQPRPEPNQSEKSKHPEPKVQVAPNLGQVQVNGDLVHDWRIEKALSLVGAAEVLGVSHVTVSRIEAGRAIQVLTAAKIAKRLKIKLSEFCPNIFMVDGDTGKKSG